MELPVFETQDEVPESFRDAYVEKGGKWVPNIPEPKSSEDTSGLKAKNKELLEKLQASSERMKVFGDRTPEQIQEDLDLAAKTREKKAKDEGDFESLRKQIAEKHDTEKKAWLAREEKLLGTVDRFVRMDQLRAAITEAEGDVDLLLPHVLPHTKTVERDDTFEALVVDQKGSPRIADGSGAPMTPKQLVEEFKADPKFGKAFASNGARGFGSKNEPGARGGAGVITIPRDASTQEYRRLKEQAEKEGRPYQVAS